MEENLEDLSSRDKGKGITRKARPIHLEDVKQPDRTSSGISELDRVLGGGFVSGSVILLSGEPGIGKSTLLLQVAAAMAQGGKKVLYVSGEESESQIALRAKRLGIGGDGLLLASTEDVDSAMEEVDSTTSLFVLDSLQTMRSGECDGWPGTPSQVRAVCQSVIARAKMYNVPSVIVGHITKSGTVAGPKVVEHMVDVVLMFSGDTTSSPCRILRGIKNRFGSADEVGVFEMGERGLASVDNPSGSFWEKRDGGMAPGIAFTVTMEGSRPLVTEIQALTSPTPFPYPKRISKGIDAGRLQILAAVLERRGGVEKLVSNDIYVNVTGGLDIREPASDLALCAAVFSSLVGRPLPQNMCFIGEVGLAGEIRPPVRTEARIREAARLGFDHIFTSTRYEGKIPHGCRIIKVSSIEDMRKRI